MANSFFTHVNPFLPGAVARSDGVNTKFDAVEAGFDAVEVELSDVFRFHPDATPGNTVIPNITVANTFVAFDENGDVTLIDRSALDTAVTDAQGHASNAATSSSNAATSETNAGNSASSASVNAGNAGTSATQAATARTGAETARTGAETARDKAQKWAEELEDVEVDPGEYSAYHWARKAMAAMGGTITVAWGDVTGKPTEFNPSTHLHTIAEVTGLQTALDGKSDTGHEHAGVYAGVSHSHTAADLPDATLLVKGIVQLENATNSGATDMAATPSAVNNIRMQLADKADTTHGHTASDIPDGTILAKGVVQLSNLPSNDEATAATPKAVKSVEDALTSHTHTNPNDLPDASTSAQGVVQLNDTLTSTATDQAATANAVKQLKDQLDAGTDTVIYTGPSADLTMSIALDADSTFEVHVTDGKVVTPRAHIFLLNTTVYGDSDVVVSTAFTDHVQQVYLTYDTVSNTLEIHSHNGGVLWRVQRIIQIR